MTFLIYSLCSVLVCFLGLFLANKLVSIQSLRKTLLPFSAGIIFGIVSFHLIPETLIPLENESLIIVLCGFFLPIFFERFSKKNYRASTHGDLPMFNILTFFSFTLHALVDGLLIAQLWETKPLEILIVLGILLHKLPVSFSLMTILNSHMKNILLKRVYFAIFTLMTPIGIVFGITYLNQVSDVSSIKNYMSFAIGSLLYISLIHLIYDHKLFKGKIQLLTIVAGILVSLLSDFIH